MHGIAESQSIITGLFTSFQVIERLEALPEAYRKEISANIADKLSRLILLDIKQIKDIFGVLEQMARHMPLIQKLSYYGNA